MDPERQISPVIALQWTSMTNYKICYEEFQKSDRPLTDFWHVWNTADASRNHGYLSPSMPTLADIGFWRFFWASDKYDSKDERDSRRQLWGDDDKLGLWDVWTD